MSMSIPSTSTRVPDAQACASVKTPFERNEDNYGTVAASALGLAQAATDQASASVTWSAQAMDKFASLAHEAHDVVSDAVHAVSEGVHGVENAVVGSWHGLEDAVASGYREVKQEVGEVGDAIGHAATSAYEAVAHAGDELVGGVAMVAQAVREAV